MGTTSQLRSAVALALAAVLGLGTVATAQNQSAKEGKSTKSGAAKSESKSDSKKSKQAEPALTAAVGDGQPTLLGQFGDWGAYTATNGGKKVCYALAKPSSGATQPANRPRDPAYVFISTRPSENVRNEVSVVIGYPFKPDSDATVDIGSAKYTMYTKQDGAWIKNVAEEARMVDAMRRGGDMVVSGESGRGTKSTDRYTLKGLSQALDRVAQECK